MIYKKTLYRLRRCKIKFEKTISQNMSFLKMDKFDLII